MQIKKGQVYTRHLRATYIKDIQYPYVKFGYVYVDLPDFTLHQAKIYNLPYRGTLKPWIIRKIAKLCPWLSISPITPPVA